jgi:hypothetical protein
MGVVLQLVLVWESVRLCMSLLVAARTLVLLSLFASTSMLAWLSVLALVPPLAAALASGPNRSVRAARHPEPLPVHARPAISRFRHQRCLAKADKFHHFAHIYV